MVFKPYTPPQGRPRSIPPTTPNPCSDGIAVITEDYSKMKKRTDYARAATELLAKYPGRVIPINELVRHMRQSHAFVANVLKKSAWPISKDGSSFSFPEGVRIITHLPAFSRRNRAARAAPLLTITAETRSAFDALKELVVSATGIDVTDDQALNWLRNKIKGTPDLRF